MPLSKVSQRCFAKHGYSIAHEDNHGAFVIEDNREDNADWLRAPLCVAVRGNQYDDLRSLPIALGSAEEFAQAATRATAETAIICQTQEEFEKHDIFPWQLYYPVVLVPRLHGDIEAEEDIETLAEEFGGEFAGT